MGRRYYGVPSGYRPRMPLHILQHINQPHNKELTCSRCQQSHTRLRHSGVEQRRQVQNDVLEEQMKIRDLRGLAMLRG